MSLSKSCDIISAAAAFQLLKGIFNMGKNEICPFTIVETEKENSYNYVAGSPIMKYMGSISRNQYRKMLINLVIPMGKTKCSFNSSTQKNSNPTRSTNNRYRTNRLHFFSSHI